MGTISSIWFLSIVSLSLLMGFMEVLIVQNLFHGILHSQVDDAEAFFKGSSLIALKPLHHDSLYGSIKEGIWVPLRSLYHLSSGFTKLFLFIRAEGRAVLLV